jgi:hypothetical protein
MKQYWFHRLYKIIKIGLLHIKHLTTLRPVELKSLETGEGQIQDKWRTIIIWNIRGCNCINIEGYGVFPGNIKSVSIKATDKKRFLTITFIGVFNRITRQVSIGADERSLISQTSVVVHPFPASPAQFRLQQILPTITHQFIKIQEVDFSLRVGIHPSAVEYLNICSINQTNQ